MNENLNNNDENNHIDVDRSDAVNKISIKSNNIKAALKYKYLISKIEKSFYNYKFML